MLLKILQVKGHSMQPTILNTRKVIVIPYFFTKPKKNDIVAFRFKKEIFIKRIREIKGNKYFLEGDNKKDSLDSKKIGLIEKKEIIGKVIWN